MDHLLNTAAVVGGTTFVVAYFWWLRRRALIKSVNVTNKRGVVYDCVVCLCEVSPRDECRRLPKCEHGVQFHADCIGAWLKDHSTCPICRSHIPQPLVQYLISYCNYVLDNVATSIGDCHDFNFSAF